MTEKEVKSKCERCLKEGVETEDLAVVFFKSETGFDEGERLVTTTLRQPLFIKTCRSCWEILRPPPYRRWSYLAMVILLVGIPGLYAAAMLMMSWNSSPSVPWHLNLMSLLGLILLLYGWYYVSREGLIKPLLRYEPRAIEKWLKGIPEAEGMENRGYVPVAFLEIGQGFRPDMLYELEDFIKPDPPGIRIVSLPVIQKKKPEPGEDTPKRGVFERRDNFNKFVSRFTVVEDFSKLDLQGFTAPPGSNQCLICGGPTETYKHLIAKKLYVEQEDPVGDEVEPKYRIFHFPICERCVEMVREQEEHPSSSMVERLWKGIVVVLFGALPFATWWFLSLQRARTPYQIGGTFDDPMVTGVIVFIVFVISFFWILAILSVGGPGRIFLPRHRPKDLDEKIHHHWLFTPGVAHMLAAVFEDGWMPVFGLEFQPWVVLDKTSDFLEAFCSSRPDLAWCMGNKIEKYNSADTPPSAKFPWPDLSRLDELDGTPPEPSCICEFCHSPASEGVGMSVLMHRRELVERGDGARGLSHDFGIVEIPICKRCRTSFGMERQPKKPAKWWKFGLIILFVIGIILPVNLALKFFADIPFEGVSGHFARMLLVSGSVFIYAMIVLLIMNSIPGFLRPDYWKVMHSRKQIVNPTDFDIIREAMADGWRPVEELELGEWMLTSRLERFFGIYGRATSRAPVKMRDDYRGRR